MFARAEPRVSRRHAAGRSLSGPWLMLLAGAALRAAAALLPAHAAAPEPWLVAARHIAVGTGASTAPDVAPLTPWLASFWIRSGVPGEWRLVVFLAILGAFVPLLVTALGRALFGEGVGTWAGWIAAVDPLAVRPESAPAGVTAVFLLLALVLTAAWIVEPRPGRALGVGLAWGVASLAHPAALLLPVLVLPWAWVPLGLVLPAAGRARQIAFAISGLGGIVVPWILARVFTGHSAFGVLTGAWSVLPGTGVVLRRLGEFVALPGGIVYSATALVLLPFWLAGVVLALSGPRRWFQALGLLPIVCFGAFAIPSPADARAAVEPLFVLFAAAGFLDLRRRLRARTHGLRVIEGLR